MKKSTRIERVCGVCGVCFGVLKSQLIHSGKGRYCSKLCRNKAGGMAGLAGGSGKENLNWRGGITATSTKRYRKRNPERHAAHQAVTSAIESGRLIKQPCEKCGDTKHVQAHHDDYSKPLDVTWLCRRCHCSHHSKIRRLKATPSERAASIDAVLAKAVTQ